MTRRDGDGVMAVVVTAANCWWLDGVAWRQGAGALPTVLVLGPGPGPDEGGWSERQAREGMDMVVRLRRVLVEGGGRAGGGGTGRRPASPG